MRSVHLQAMSGGLEQVGARCTACPEEFARCWWDSQRHNLGGLAQGGASRGQPQAWVWTCESGTSMGGFEDLHVRAG